MGAGERAGEESHAGGHAGTSDEQEGHHMRAGMRWGKRAEQERGRMRGEYATGTGSRVEDPLAGRMGIGAGTEKGGGGKQ